MTTAANTTIRIEDILSNPTTFVVEVTASSVVDAPATIVTTRLMVPEIYPNTAEGSRRFPGILGYPGLVVAEIEAMRLWCTKGRELTPYELVVTDWQAYFDYPGELGFDLAADSEALLLGPGRVAPAWSGRNLGALLVAEVIHRAAAGCERVVASASLLGDLERGLDASELAGVVGFDPVHGDVFTADPRSLRVQAAHRRIVEELALTLARNAPADPGPALGAEITLAHGGPTRVVVTGRGDLVEIPDFEELFPLCPDHGHRPYTEQLDGHGCETCDERVLSPRLACFVSQQLWECEELWGMDLAHVPEHPDGTIAMEKFFWASTLPPVARDGRTREWVVQFIGCFRSLAERLARGKLPCPRSTGEEMALHIALDCAADSRANGLTEEECASWCTSLPEAPGIDTDFDMLETVLFEDHDVLMLFDDQLAGIESNKVLVDRMGLVNLHPDDWFIPFCSEED